jgi:hypothetical protein
MENESLKIKLTTIVDRVIGIRNGCIVVTWILEGI